MEQNKILIENIKSNIKKLIDLGNLDDAIDLIRECEKVTSKDIDLYSMEVVINILKNNLDQAEKTANLGLSIDNNNFDLLYNLGYIYKLQNKYVLAFSSYHGAFLNCKEHSLKTVIENELKFIKEKILESMISSIKKKDFFQVLEITNLIQSFYENEDFLREVYSLINYINQNNLEELLIQFKSKCIENKDKFCKLLNLESNIKYVHLMIDSQYAKRFIDFINENFNEEEHAFIISNDWDSNFIDEDTYGNVYRIKYSNFMEFEYLKTIYFAKKNKRVFIHYLSNNLCYLINKYNLKDNLHWIKWGGDFYTYTDIKLYDSMTKELIKDKYEGIKYENYKGSNLQQYREKSIRKISHMLCFKQEYKLIKEYFYTEAKFKNFLYPNPVNFEEINSITDNLDRTSKFKLKQKFNKVILLGNSADPTNNHIDMLFKLKELKGSNVCVISSLSYGNKKYAKEIIKIGKELLEDNFIPLTEYLSPNEYFTLLNEVDTAIFNFNRSQGFSNIILLLYLGKKVYIKGNITIFEFLKEKDIKIYDLNLVKSFKELFEIDEKLENNITIVEKEFSSNAILNIYKKIFSV